MTDEMMNLRTFVERATPRVPIARPFTRIETP
jgi:hypothetical protein